jgi:hypothetical protein
MTKTKTPSAFLTVAEAGREYFGIRSKQKAYEAAHAGVIPFFYVGRVMRVARMAAEKRHEEIANRSLTEKSVKVV